MNTTNAPPAEASLARQEGFVQAAPKKPASSSFGETALKLHENNNTSPLARQPERTDSFWKLEVEKLWHQLWIEALKGVVMHYAKSKLHGASEVIDCAIYLKERLEGNQHKINQQTKHLLQDSSPKSQRQMSTSDLINGG